MPLHAARPKVADGYRRLPPDPPPWASGDPSDNLFTVSTRMLILASLLCGLAILVAFTVQVLIAT